MSGPLFSEPAVENQLNSGLGIAAAVPPTGGDSSGGRGVSKEGRRQEPGRATFRQTRKYFCS